MKKTGLKSFDIASFDMEIEFNKKLAPIRKKIDTLNRNHEKKSLDNHKDFLSKEKKSQKKLKELSEKAILRDQRISKAAENKLKKYVNIDQKLKAKFDEFKLAQEQANNILLTEIDELVADMKIAEGKDLEAIQRKYDISVQSYTEKLSMYNENYIKNVKRHEEHLSKYQELVDAKINEIENFKINSSKILDQELEDFIKANEERKEEVKVENVEKQKDYTKAITQVKRDANVIIKKSRAYVEELKQALSDKYDSFIQLIQENISSLTTDFSERKELIIKDRDINLEKLNASLETDEEIPPKLRKSIDMKLAIFEQRAATTIRYEEAILNEQIALLEHEITELKHAKKLELLNYDKLEVFLVSDQAELKETGDHFKKLNFKLLSDLNNSEFAHSEYLEKHETLKNEYYKTFNDTFNGFKLAILEANQRTIERLGQINSEIDEINKYLDTAEPLKEIEVNNIRVEVEKSEIIERYKIKYAKQDHEQKLLNANVEKEVLLEEQQVKKEMIDNNKLITDIKNKEKYDKDVEKVKLKFNKAEEVARLRHNSVRLERGLLKSNYETEEAIMDHDKDIAEIDILRENALLSNELTNQIANIELESNYKIEVIYQSLVEDNLKFDEEISALQSHEKKELSQIDKQIKQEEKLFVKQKKELEKEFTAKSKLVDKALERELREPRKSLQKSNQVIDNRLRVFTQNDDTFKDFILGMIKHIEDPTMNDEQKQAIIANDSMLIDKSKTYLTNVYDSLQDALQFIYELQTRTLQSKLASTTEDSKSRKLNKELQKVHQEFEKQRTRLDTNRKENLTLITNDIYKGIEQIGNFNAEKEGTVAEYITSVLTTLHSGLQSLQSGVLDEVKELYSVLTKSDNDIVTNAELNAEKAKALISQEQTTALKPFEDVLRRKIEEIEKTRSEFKEQHDLLVNEIKANINTLKTEAIAQVKQIELEKAELSRPYKEQLEAIKSGEIEKINKQKEGIEAKKRDLEIQYRESQNKLALKDSETEKILDYERRIYNLALETAEARFNDANQKTETAFVSQHANLEKRIAEINEKHERMVADINKELVTLTKEFENNIFTVRPRLDESIGDAQNIIDSESTDKRHRLEELNDISEQVMTTLEQSVNTKFQDCYARLLDNLQFYFDKLKLIKDEHMRKQRENNNAIEEDNAIFSNALFELSKSKHQKTLKKLLDINRVMTGKEE